MADGKDNDKRGDGDHGGFVRREHAAATSSKEIPAGCLWAKSLR